MLDRRDLLKLSALGGAVAWVGACAGKESGKESGKVADEFELEEWTVGRLQEAMEGGSLSTRCAR